MADVSLSPEVMSHIQEHIEKWPASKQEIVSACNQMSDVKDEDKQKFMQSLPDKTYGSPDEVMEAMQM